MSGKGGSGKTSICVTIAKILALQNKKVLLIDSDSGTGGMTYYLGLNIVQNKKVGLLDLAKDESLTIKDITQKFLRDENINFIGIGNHRQYSRNNKKALTLSIKRILEKVENSYDYIIMDCRGGLDDETVEITKLVNDIVFIVEPDTTSFQATQYLSDTLSDYKIAHKIKGFIINKVFDDPVAVARNGAGVFGGMYLDAIPFDIEAMRSFLIGCIANEKSLYFSHVWKAISKAYPNEIKETPYKTLNSKEYNKITTLNPNAQLGNLIIGFISMILISLLLYSEYFAPLEILSYKIILYSLFVIVLLNVSNFFKDNLGYVIKRIFQLLAEITKN